MPIDPSIPLGVKPMQGLDILGGALRGAQIARQQAITQQEQAQAVRQQKLDAREDAAEAKKQAVTEVLRRHGGDMAKALPEIMGIDPEIGMKVQTTVNSSLESGFKLKNAKLAHDRAMAEEIGRKAQGVKDQDSYGYFLADLKASGLPTEGMSPEYQPAYVEGLKTKSLTVLENATLEEKRLVAEYNKWKAQQEIDNKVRDDARADAGAAETRRHNSATEAAARATNARLAAGGGDSPLVAIVGPDGKPVLVRRSQAEGKTPASTRDSGGGRGVTSGDAGRIADFDTSIDDVAVLRKTISGNKATGTKAAIGAALPNAVTEFTGWGAEAKDKQAVIDRVKQVIGKTLEGGVLRKEDEYKYTKILPTISDPTPLVISKLAGLDQAVKLRKERLLDSLDDAGYNTESYKARQPKTTESAKPRFEIISVK